MHTDSNSTQTRTKGHRSSLHPSPAPLSDQEKRENKNTMLLILMVGMGVIAALFILFYLYCRFYKRIFGTDDEQAAHKSRTPPVALLDNTSREHISRAGSLPDGYSSQRTSIAETIVEQGGRQDRYIDPDIRRPATARTHGNART